jgi:hypothetical protein
MKIRTACLFLALFSVAVTGGSVRSFEGVGTLLGLANGRSMGMAGTALAVPGSFDLPRINPASLSSIELSRFSIQYMYESNHYKTSSGSANAPYSNFDGFSFGFPFTRSMAFALGLAPYSKVDFRTSFPDAIGNTVYDQIISGSGGINILNLMLSFRLINRLSVGVGGKYYFGRIEKNWLVNFTETAYTTTKNTFASQVSGQGSVFGIQFALNPLTIGAVFEPKIRLDSKEFLNFQSIDDVLNITIPYYRDTLNQNLELPGMIGLGIGVQLGRKSLIGLDWIHSDWKKLDGYSSSIQLQNTNRFSMGVEYMPSQNPYASFFNKSQYRAGFAIESYYLKSAGGNAIQQWWVTMGIGIPIWNQTSRTNIALAYGQRGSLESNKLSENIFRIILSLDAGEQWFVRGR